MKITVLQNDLNKWMSMAVRTVPTRVQMPVLANVLLEGEKEGVFLSATNLEIGIRVSVGGKVEQTGAITVPAKNFAEFVGSLPPGNIELETEGEKIKVTGGKLTAVFSGIAATEFPVISKLEEIKSESKTIKFKRGLIEDIASELAYCAATDESRPVLTGVMFLSEGKQLKVTATDGFRLSRKIYELEEEIGGFDKGMVLPARTIVEAGKILSEGRKDVLEMGIVKGSNQVIFGYGGVEMTSRVLEGNFPDVDKIIPREWKNEVEVDREELLRAVRAAGVFARDSANVVRFTVSENSLEVESSSAQTGESKTTIEAKTDGDEVKISFNYRYVLDFLGSIETEVVRLRLTDAVTAGIFGIKGDDSLTHLIMPVRV